MNKLKSKKQVSALTLNCYLDLLLLLKPFLVTGVYGAGHWSAVLERQAVFRPASANLDMEICNA